MRMLRSRLSRYATHGRREDGQTLLEYALLLALVSIVSIGVLGALGVDIKNLLFQVSTRMSQVSNP
jgi:Flp pilus assembly pilin Flp